MIRSSTTDTRQRIAEGDMVCVESARGKVDIKALITDEVKPGILSRTFHFPKMMLNLITRSTIFCFAVHLFRCSVSDSLAILRQAQDGVCPEYKVVSSDPEGEEDVFAGGRRGGGEGVSEGVPALKCSAGGLFAASSRSFLAVGFSLQSLTRALRYQTLHFLR